MRCVVVGGGLAGLVTAASLTQRGVAVTVLEAADRPGGVMTTLREDGWLIEGGPQSFLSEEGDALTRAIAWAGLEGEVLEPRPAARLRYVRSRGRLFAVPRGVPGLLSLRGLARAMAEVAVRRRRSAAPETVWDFACRRFGEEVARRLFDPLVTGIFAGDPHRLELQSALPRVAALEAAHGSLFRAVLRGAGPGRRPRSLRRGLGSLPEGLAARLGAAFRPGTPVEGLRPVGSGQGGWTVLTPAGEEACDAVVLALAAPAAARLVHDFDHELAAQLEAEVSAPVSVVHLGYDARAFLDRPPEGFGFLVPHEEGSALLGCLFPASLFEGAAPPDKVALRALIGGRRRPDLAALPDDELVSRARAELEPLLGAAAPPEMVRVLRPGRGIPQYELGHAVRLGAIDARLGSWAGLHLAGWSYEGIALGEVARQAEAVAGRVAAGAVGAVQAPGTVAS